MNERREEEIVSILNGINSAMVDLTDYLDALVKALKNINRTLEGMEGSK